MYYGLYEVVGFGSLVGVTPRALSRAGSNLVAVNS